MLRAEDSKARIRFEVSDTGIGMSEEAIKSVFAAFSQADNSTTRKFGGTGLGLSICKRLAELMNSEIKVYSQPGRGSRFWFDLDLPLGAPLDAVTGSDQSAPTHVSAGARILVAEDNQINQRVLMEVLRQAGYEPSGASHGAEALKLMKSGKIDVVLMDCQMPELDGFEATTKWRESTHPEAKKLPIIALTANATKSGRERAFAVGMNDYLAKPCVQKLLFARSNVGWRHPLPCLENPSTLKNSRSLEILLSWVAPNCARRSSICFLIKPRKECKSSRRRSKKEIGKLSPKQLTL